MPKKINLSKSFNNTLRILKADIIAGVKRGTQFSKPFKPNAESTKKQKGHGQPLIDKGTFTDPSTYKEGKATPQKQEATLTIVNEEVAKIALINQTSKKHPRPFYGISKNVIKKSNKEENFMINKYVDDQLISMGFEKK